MSSISDSIQYIRCTVCSEMYDDSVRVPKRLPCVHTACFVCAQKMIQDGGRIVCPVCDAAKVIASSDELVTDLTTLQMMNVMSLYKCDDCPKYDTQLGSCQKCSSRSCKECLPLHRSDQHCYILTSFREIGKEVTPENVNKALEIQAAIDAEIHSFDQLRRDVEASFNEIQTALNERNTAVLSLIAKIENRKERLDDYTSGRDFLKKQKARLDDDDADIQALHYELQKMKNLVKTCEGDERLGPFTLNFNVDEIIGCLNQLGITEPDDGSSSAAAQRTDAELQDNAMMSNLVDIDYTYTGSVKRELISEPDMRFWSVITGIAVCPTSGHVYITDKTDSAGNCRIHIMDPCRDWARIGGLRIPHSVDDLTVISDSMVAVADKEKDSVHVYSTGGVAIHEFGSSGHDNEDERFSGPMAVGHCRGRLFIADMNNDRIIIWTSDGEFCNEIKHDMLRRPCKLVTNQRGDIVVNCDESQQILVFDCDCRFKCGLDMARSHDLTSVVLVCTDRKNNLIVAGKDKDDRFVMEVFDDRLRHVRRIRPDLPLVDGISAMGVAMNGDILVATTGIDQSRLLIL